jgi:hypothetical protein
MNIRKQNSWFKMFSTEWKRKWKKMIENDLVKIPSERTLNQRLLILSIDPKRRKYVQIRLENSDSFNFRSEIFKSKEESFNAFEDRISKKRSSVRVLSFDCDHQDTRLNSIREKLASISHKSLFCTIDFLLFFFKSIFLVISIS